MLSEQAVKPRAAACQLNPYLAGTGGIVPFSPRAFNSAPAEGSVKQTGDTGKRSACRTAYAVHATDLLENSHADLAVTPTGFEMPVGAWAIESCKLIQD